ncbi:hypothetical protein [Acinetobacter sp. TGL-Y2]|uniref:hypothetical protein n=1 Tax=Acinetobacter sp. TGL-Y2 TaxID=1407071 RepID=UPI0009D708CA|nr:hypothetical protein [Acinetobacter sp. TGL-Y2]
MLWIMGFLILLLVILSVLNWRLIHQHQHLLNEANAQIELQTQVDALELNLQKTLEIMQDLAKKMQLQQEVLDLTALKLNQVEQQNADLVGLVSDLVGLKESQRMIKKL